MRTVDGRAFDSTDSAIHHALNSATAQIPVTGRASGWKRIDRALYGGNSRQKAWWPSVTRRQVVAVVVALILVLVAGHPVAAALSHLRWKLAFASKGRYEARWQTDFDLRALQDIGYSVLIAEPGSTEWVLEEATLSNQEGVRSALGLRYRGANGAVLTVREEPAGEDHSNQGRMDDNPNRFLAKMGGLNVAFFLPSGGLVSASWVADGVAIEVWGDAALADLVRFIENLVPAVFP